MTNGRMTSVRSCSGTASSRQGGDRLRRELAPRFALPFGRLVVTQLGGGVAADRRTANPGALRHDGRRSDVLHLVLVWPKTMRAARLVAWPGRASSEPATPASSPRAADLCISAAGTIRSTRSSTRRCPAIFMPQMGEGMDDQTARARAASGSRSGGLVEPDQLHDARPLDRPVLGRGRGRRRRQRMAALDLPPPGQRPSRGADRGGDE